MRRGNKSTRSSVVSRATARCGKCGLVGAGTTRVEDAEWYPKPVESHLCDDCRSTLEERPLTVVLEELIEEERPG